jgi:hypothetical protein
MACGLEPRHDPMGPPTSQSSVRRLVRQSPRGETNLSDLRSKTKDISGRMTRLVYIGGYGHSGSTLLEYLMTASPQVIACGEVVNVRGSHPGKRKCSCGKPANTCPLWGPLFHQLVKLNRRRHEDIDLALLQQVSENYSIMVDSSKTAWRGAAAPFRLRRKLREDFFLVHIVRDPRAVCWSLIKRSKRVGGRHNHVRLCVTTALGWWFANLACELFNLMFPDQSHRLRYEDMARAPQEVLTTLSGRLFTEDKWCIDAIGTSDNRHQLHGNRMRARTLSLTDVKEDTAWRKGMPATYRQLAAALSVGLRRRYGYA